MESCGPKGFLSEENLQGRLILSMSAWYECRNVSTILLGKMLKIENMFLMSMVSLFNMLNSTLIVHTIYMKCCIRDREVVYLFTKNIFQELYSRL